MIATELRRRKAAAELNNVLDGLRAQPGEPMSEVRISKFSQFDNRKSAFVISPTPGFFNSMTTSGRPLTKLTKSGRHV